MNEDIGAKGGKNDRRRSLKITKMQKEKLEKQERLSKEEIKKLEAEVRKQQILNFITVIPLVIFGGIFYTFKSKKTEEQEFGVKSKRNKRIDAPGKLIDNESELKEKQTKQEIFSEQQENKIPVLDTNKEIKPTKIETHEELLEKEISNAKSKKIIEEYENKIKEIRSNLRNIYFESDILNEVKDLENSPSEKNLEKLNDLIYKLEELKKRVEKESKIEMDENYISALADEDLEKMKQNIEVEKINNSQIYASISQKIEEIKEVEEKVEEKLQQEKQEKNIENEKFNSMKEKYQKVDDFHQELKKFQQEQNVVLEDIRNKMQNQVNKIDKAGIELNGMNMQSKLLMKRMKKQMRIPGVRSGRRIANMMASFLYYFGLMKNPAKNTRQQKKIEVKDFSKDIESNIKEIDNVLNTIAKTSDQLDKTIREFLNDYGEYASSKEFQEILRNLEKMKRNLEEKEYEIQKIKKEQEKALTRNNEKVKTYIK